MFCVMCLCINVLCVCFVLILILIFIHSTIVFIRTTRRYSAAISSRGWGGCSREDCGTSWRRSGRRRTGTTGSETRIGGKTGSSYAPKFVGPTTSVKRCAQQYCMMRHAVYFLFFPCIRRIISCETGADRGVPLDTQRHSSYWCRLWRGLNRPLSQENG